MDADIHARMMQRRRKRWAHRPGTDLRCDFDCGFCWPADVDKAMLARRAADAAAANGLTTNYAPEDDPHNDLRRGSK